MPVFTCKQAKGQALSANRHRPYGVVGRYEALGREQEKNNDGFAM